MELTEYLWKDDCEEQDMVEAIKRMVQFIYHEIPDDKYLRVNLRVVDYQQGWNGN